MPHASVVINGARSGTRISEKTRQTIIEAAARIGYRPNGLARSLTTGKTNLIGVYSGRTNLDSRNFFFAELPSAEFWKDPRSAGANTVIHTNAGGPSRPSRAGLQSRVGWTGSCMPVTMTPY